MNNDAPRILIMVDKMVAGGMERQVITLLDGLKRNGRFRVLFAVLDHGGEWDAEAARLSEAVLPIRRKARFDFTPALSLIRQGHAAGVQLVHTFSWMSGLAALVAARLLRIPIINGNIRSTPPVLGLRDRVARWCAFHSDAIVANSCAGLAAYGLLDHPRARVIPNGIDPGRFEGVVPQRNEEPTICMVANFSRLKDHATAIRAMPSIRRAFPQTTLILVGSDAGTLTENRQLAAGLGLSDATRVVMHTTHPEPYIAGSQVCVLTSPEGEGLSNAILEYMILGKPVVATACGGNAALIRDGETGFLVPQEASELLAARVIELLRDPEKARRMGEAGRQQVLRDYSAASMVAEYEALYGRLLDRHRAP